jgi:rhodanese-related sulfurtransferase
MLLWNVLRSAENARLRRNAFASAAAALLLHTAPAFAGDPGATPTVSSVPTAAESIHEISRASFSERWAREHQDLTVVDVRSTEEFAAGHVPGAINIPVDQLEGRLSELNSGDEIVVYCFAGPRAAAALELLLGREFKRVEHLRGDFSEWESSGGPIETAAR